MERTKLAELQAALTEVADRKGEYFEDLGVDQLYVDEADNYKNLRYVTKMGDVKGLPQSRSRRAWDMFLKSQYLQGGVATMDGPGRPDGDGFARRGVVFATGTPVANTIAEAWTMMRYLQLRELRKRGLHHFDAWAKNYGRTTSGLEKTPQGTYKQVTRFANFNNLPELSALLQNVADIRVASEVPQMLAVQPRLVDRDGNAKRIVEQSPDYPSLQLYMSDLEERADNMGEVDPSEDNMLKLSNDARRASLDIRMVDWPFPEERPVPNPEGKLPMAAENVAEVYEAEAADRGTQIIFLDMGTPKGDDGKDQGDDGKDQESLTRGAQDILRDAYRVLKRELVEEGVPEKQIAFIHDHKTKEKQLALFEKVRSGDVRVLVGSTGKLGVGVNVQDRAAAIHHIDVPWRPRDIEQREGRIIRQGNKVYGPVIDEATGAVLSPGKGVKIFTYVQEGSFDEFMWQGVEKKGQAIKTLMKRYITQRKIEDIDPLVLSAAEAKPLASGDPRIMRLEELKQRVATLQLEKAAYDSAQRNASVQVETLGNQVADLRRRLPAFEADAKLAQAALDEEEKFDLAVGGKSHGKRPDANQALKASMAKLPYKAEWRQVGEYQGLNIMAANTDVGYQIALVNPATGVFHQSRDIEELGSANVVTRIDNVLKGMTLAANDARNKLVQSEESLDFYQVEAAKDFEKRSDLRRADNEMMLLRQAIEGVDATSAPSGPAYEVEADTEVSAIITDSDDESYETARAKVVGEVTAAMLAGGRDYKVPTQDEIDELIAQELRDRRPPAPTFPPEVAEELPAAQDADIAGSATDNPYPGPVAAEVSQRVIDEINDADQTGAVVIADERVTDQVADGVAEAIAETPNPAISEVATGAGDGPAVVAVEIPPMPDLVPDKTEDVTERIAERVLEDIADDGDQGKDVTVITNDNLDGMIPEEVRDEASTLSPDVLPAKADQLAAPVEQSGRALDLDEAIAIGDVVTEYENLWRRYHAHPDERSSLQEQLNEVRARYWQLIAKYNMNEEWVQRSLDDVESESRYADNPELNEKRESIYRDWAPAIGSERARERADADIAEFVADAYDNPDAPAFELGVPETNTIRPIELPASFADIAPEWSTSDPFSAEAATEPLTVDADHLPPPVLDVPAPIVPAPIVPAPIVIDEPPAFEPMVADAPAPLVESLPTAVDPGVAERAAELEQEIALCQTQAEVARQQHPGPTAAVTEVRADIATAEANLEALSDAVGLPDPDTLPDNVVRLELQSDGSVTAVVVESEPERVPDSPTPTPEPEPTPEPTRQREPVESDQPKEPVEPTRNPDPDHTPVVEAKDAELVDTGRAWQDLTHEEKAKAVAEYNKALSALRTLAEVAREIEETNNVGWAWEAKCSQLQQELTALLRPTPQSPLLAPLIEPMATPAAMPGIERTPAITVESTGYT